MQTRAYYLAHRSQKRATSLAQYRKHRIAIARRKSLKSRALRVETITAYGGRCACCGETELSFLCMDHVHGDGAAHRRTLGGHHAGGRKMYLWLKREGFPKDRFRVLCYNCNIARGLYGQCPHELAPERAATA